MALLKVWPGLEEAVSAGFSLLSCRIESRGAAEPLGSRWGASWRDGVLRARLRFAEGRARPAAPILSATGGPLLIETADQLSLQVGRTRLPCSAVDAGWYKTDADVGADLLESIFGHNRSLEMRVLLASGME